MQYMNVKVAENISQKEKLGIAMLVIQAQAQAKSSFPVNVQTSVWYKHAQCSSACIERLT